MSPVSQVLVILLFSALGMSSTDSHNHTLPSSTCGGKEKVSTLLKIAKDFVNQSKSLFPNCSEDASNCGKKETSFALLDVAMDLISEVNKSYPTCNKTECPKPVPVERPMDCSEVLRSGKNASGVYTIWPRSRVLFNKSVDVYCDMVTDGGGWTVIQRRGKFSTPKDYFYKDWQNYKVGFGNLREEFWIGNDNIYRISNQGNYTIRFDLKGVANDTGYAKYHTFWIGHESDNYTLHINGYSGNVGDDLQGVDGMQFSTKDRKNDLHTAPCAVDKQGAWWYKACCWANLNGIYDPGVDSRSAVTWHGWYDNWIGLSGSEIKLRS